MNHDWGPDIDLEGETNMLAGRCYPPANINPAPNELLEPP